MREIINRLLEEKFDHDQGIVSFSSDREELNLAKGEIREGSFKLTVSGSLRPAEGYISATGDGMSVLQSEFTGNEVTIGYRFDSKGMDEGDVLQGEFVVVSNKGEYYLPYVVTIEHRVLHSSLGPIKNMFHFTNLAKENWKEAVTLFYSPDFKKIFGDSEANYLAYYILLSAIPMKEQNVEEFLNVIHKKEKVEYFFKEDQIRIDDPSGFHQCEIEVIKSGWGYVHLDVIADCDFLFCEKKSIEIEDFENNTCTYKVFIDSTKLHVGNNMGTIVFMSPYDRMEVKVRVVVNKADKIRVNHIRDEKRMMTQMITYYLAFRLRKINKETWISESLQLIDKLNAIDDRNLMSRLFQAHLLIAEERFNEARWILDHVESILSRDVPPEDIWCYYLYLTTLYNRDEAYVDEITEEIEEIYNKDRSNWHIAWTLLFLREEFQENSTKKWLFMEEQYELGCISPIWYVEALQLLLGTPTLLMKLGDFEQQILWFAVRNEIMTKELLAQLNLMINKTKVHSERVLWILERSYEKYRDLETLQSICSLLIKNNKTNYESLKWYRLGVENELRITHLYEYFMYSVDLKKAEPLPKMLLMYFAYHSELDFERNAYLYAYVVRCKDKMPEIYETYLGAIDRFLVDQIHKGHINRDLAYLYYQMVSPAMLNQETALEMIPIIFTNLVEVERDDIRRVILINERTSGEYPFYVDDHQAYVPIYSKEYVLALEDSHGNRYIEGIPYILEKMIIPGKMVKMIDAFEPVHFGFDLYHCENYKGGNTLESDSVERFERLSESDRITKDYRQEIRRNLMHYFFENDMVHEMDVYLDNLDPDSMLPIERAEAMQYMILRGMYEKAYQWIGKFGVSGVDPKVLVRLCSRMISRGEMEEDATMTELTYYVFQKGKYDEFVLRYLVRFFTGLTRQLRNIWKAAESFDIDSQRIVERMLLQMMYTGSFVGEKMEIFRSYVRNGGSEEVEEAFLSFCAYDYFVKERLEDDFVFEELLRHYHRGNQLNVVCRLAILKYYSEHPGKRSASENEDLKSILREMCKLNLYFPFFLDYTNLVPELKYMSDKTTIEYRTNPDSKVYIHYMLENDLESGGEFRKEEMVNMYGGIFEKSFSIFYGETLQYYITEVLERREQLTQSDAISKSDIAGEDGEGVFNLLNDIVIAHSMQDYDTADELLTQYYEAEYSMKDLFKLI